MRTPATAAVLLAALLLGSARSSPAAPPDPASGAAEDSLPFTEEESSTIARALHIERDLVRVVEKVRPCSVSIENWQPAGRGGTLAMTSGGSGVIISSRGYILTNQHVVDKAKELWVVTGDGERHRAKFIGNDPRGDVALIRIDAPHLRWTSPRRGRADRLVPGQWVVATGNPFFLAADGHAVVTLGVISGTGRVLGGEYFYGDAIQHDAEINPGNSGGPLWDAYGNLLGINGRIASAGAGSAGASSEGVGFTIPIDQIRNFFEAMMEGRPALHGDELLGVAVETALDDEGRPFGARVTKVEAGSPAAAARAGGIVKGDVIWRLTISGHPSEVETMRDFYRLMSPLAEGTKITVHVERGRRKLVFPNIVLDRPKRKGKR